MMNVHSRDRFPVYRWQDDAENPGANRRQNECDRNPRRWSFRFQTSHTSAIISSRRLPRRTWLPASSAADDLNSRQSGSQNGDRKQERGDVLKRLRIEPSDDLPAIEKSQYALGTEAHQAGRKQPEKKPVSADL